MKSIKKIVLTCFIFSALCCSSQNSELENIKEVITAFAKAGDKNDSQELAMYLDDNYRIVMNRLFGSESVVIMDKSTYLKKIESKEFGGDKRQLNFENITINGSSASVKVTFKGEKMTFVAILCLIQNKEGKWKLVSDIPVIK
ncbi:nuclear transport factor 2 family protein [Seonamhaeicola sp. ML3]|uniref:nuclear transport factor 2 family protein n=1 Tax=Seonamhaeicola sp. ML3 TaxID=2937786 RepID=UPI00200EC75A|nr:nuclear transport factor 2 family protein [Seonamhaeicola sp. ML3]